MNDFKQTAILGAGVIGASWAALFLASGKQVALYDIAPDAEKNVHDYIDKVWPSLLELPVKRLRARILYRKTFPSALILSMRFMHKLNLP